MMRQSDDVTHKKESDLISLRQQFESYREMQTLRDHGGWRRLKESIEANKLFAQLELKEFQKLTDKARDYYLKQMQDCDRVIDMVEGAEANMALLNEQISKRQAELDARKRPATAG